MIERLREGSNYSGSKTTDSRGNITWRNASNKVTHTYSASSGQLRDKQNGNKLIKNYK